MWQTTTNQLPAVLGEFKDRFNSNPRAKKLVTDWNRFIVLESMNTGSKHALVVHDKELREIRVVQDIDDGDDALVHLQADEAVLVEIFSGKYNPATALVDGALAVFSKERDKVKLEALAMVIWRLG